MTTTTTPHAMPTASGAAAELENSIRLTTMTKREPVIKPLCKWGCCVPESDPPWVNPQFGRFIGDSFVEILENRSKYN